MKSSRINTAVVLLAAASFVGTSVAHATLFAQYTLGEDNSTGPPVDTTGNHNFGNVQNRGQISVDTANFAPAGGSTASLFFTPASGYYSVANGGGAYPLQNNFFVDLWAKASAAGTGEPDNRLLSTEGTGGANPGLQIGVTGGFYTADLINGGGPPYFGTVFATGPAVTTAWTELSLLKVNNTTTFYVNGVAFGTTTSNVEVGTGMHLGVTPGGATSFSGNLDQLTVSTAPEPASVVLAGLGLVSLLLVARRRMRSA